MILKIVSFFLTWLGVAIYINEAHKFFVYPTRGHNNSDLMFMGAFIVLVFGMIFYFTWLSEGDGGWWRRRFWAGFFPRHPIGGKPLPKCKRYIKTKVHK